MVLLMNEYEQILERMQEFLRGTLNPQQFVERYAELWRAIRDQQIGAIDNQEDVREALQELKAQRIAGAISPDDYFQASSELFASVKNAPVAPGSEPDRILSHVFVEAGAYEEDPEFREPYQIDEDALRSAVLEALQNLLPTGTDPGSANDERSEVEE